MSEMKSKIKMEGERIQKVLANVGLGSRREIEGWIKAGRVMIDHRVAKLGDRVTRADKIKIDKKWINRLPSKQASVRILMYHKPEGEICTRRDPSHRKTIFENLPLLQQGRWIVVGRLDLNTSGLILLTTEGELAHRLMHPSYKIEREYAVRILGHVTSEMIRNLKKGVLIAGERCAFDEIIDAGGTGVNHWYKAILKEGKNREVRKLWETQGVKVSRLIRTRFGPILLPRLLRPGRFRALDKIEIEKLYQATLLVTLKA